MTPEYRTAPGAAEEVGVISILNAVLRRRFLVGSIALTLGLIAGLMGIRASHTYTADASFTVESAQPRSNLSGLAAQFGVQVPEGRGGQTPEFFMFLVRSRTLLVPVLQAEYTFAKDGRTVRATLLNELSDPDDSPARRIDLAVAALRKAISTSLDKETRVISLGVTSASPELSRQILENLLVELNRFNAERQKSQAEATRKFTEHQMESARSDLAVAEDALQQFRQQNRMIGSPELTFRQERLSREVSRRQQLYTSLSQAFDQARIEEVRSVPALTIVEAPLAQTTPNARGAAKRTLIALVLGAMAGAALALLLELAAPASGSPGELAEFSSLWHATLRDLRHPIVALRRMRDRRAAKRALGAPA